VPLREKDAGTKLERLYAAYITMAPPVHTKALGKTPFGKMLNAVFLEHRAAQEQSVYCERHLPSTLKTARDKKAASKNSPKKLGLFLLK
jgi:hypothetical protein